MCFFLVGRCTARHAQILLAGAALPKTQEYLAFGDFVSEHGRSVDWDFEQGEREKRTRGKESVWRSLEFLILREY